MAWIWRFTSVLTTKCKMPITSAWRDPRRQHGAIRVPIRPDQVELQGEEDSSHGQARVFKENVKRDAVDDERRKQGQGQRHKAVRQEERPDDQLRRPDQLHHVATTEQRAGKRCGTRGHGRLRLRDEIKKHVESEDEERKPHQDPRNGGKEAGEGFFGGIGGHGDWGLVVSSG